MKEQSQVHPLVLDAQDEATSANSLNQRREDPRALE